MNEASADDASVTEHIFPGAEQASAADCRRVQCGRCHTRWLVHRDLAGFAITCRSCAAAIAVPADPAPVPVPAKRRLGASRRSGASRRDMVVAGAQMRVALPEDAHGLPVLSTPVAERGCIGVLDDAPLKIRTRWVNRTLIETVLVLAALIVPQLIVSWTIAGGDRVVLTPLASIIGGVLVCLIAASAPAYGYGALRRTRVWFCAEAMVVALVMAALAWGWQVLAVRTWPELGEFDMVAELIQEQGLAMALVMIALCPAVFEEIGFRGLVQYRLSAVYGLGQAVLLTAVLFALAHGITLGLPFHVALGIYLCLLRVRSGSLWPCILAHGVYNGLLVIWTSG